MTLQPRDWTIIPEQTAQIARAAFPKGNIYMMMRDELQTKQQQQQLALAIGCDGHQLLSAISRFAALKPLPQDSLSTQPLGCGA
jgi:hypothetical protein